jgi:hypothetical protein
MPILPSALIRAVSPPTIHWNRADPCAVSKNPFSGPPLRHTPSVALACKSGRASPIAKELQRATSTVSRELARQGGRPLYRASEADSQALRVGFAAQEMPDSSVARAVLQTRAQCRVSGGRTWGHESAVPPIPDPVAISKSGASQSAVARQRGQEASAVVSRPDRRMSRRGTQCPSFGLSRADYTPRLHSRLTVRSPGVVRRERRSFAP